MNDKNKNIRLDIAIRERFNYSRDYSKDIITKGLVIVDGFCITKPAFKINTESIIILKEEAIQRYVSRAGLKLEEAIRYFNIDLKEKICLDVGASTGGFTDCMLQNNAKKVIAVDVGTSQLHEKIKSNKKVISLENTDIRNFSLDKLEDVYKIQDVLHQADIKKINNIDFIAIDVSFISVIKILDTIIPILKESNNNNSGTSMIILVKPQFEVGRESISKNGIVKTQRQRTNAVENIINYLEEKNLYAHDVIESPIKGSKGNTEYLLYYNYYNNILNKNLVNWNKIKNKKI